MANIKGSYIVGRYIAMTEAPIYCKTCGSLNSWQRQPDRDILTESGKVLWERWRCKTCGATTIKPVWGERKKVDYCQDIDSLASNIEGVTHESIGSYNRVQFYVYLKIIS